MNKLISFILGLFLTAATNAQPPALFQGLIETRSPEMEVMIHELNLEPGYDTAIPHRHHAYMYLYVMEGVVEMQLQGQELRRYEQGDIFTETPEDLHIKTRNPSTTATARLLLVTIQAPGTTLELLE